jgi:putative transposase
LTELKHTEPWWYDFDSQMLQQALANLKRAYGNFFEGRAKFPKFKKKKSARQSFPIPQRVKVSDGYVYIPIPTIGQVKLRQSDVIELPTKSATFKRTAVGHWFVNAGGRVSNAGSESSNLRRKSGGMGCRVAASELCCGFRWE